MSGTFNQINVNVTDVIPPDNFATIDKNAMVGTVYTKAQDNEWRADIEATTQSGIKGVLKPNTPYDAVTNPYPTPWVAGNSPLYEKYDVNQAGTFPNTKDSSDENIVVTQTDLDLNEVQIWIKNGVAQKVLKAMPQASVNVRKWEYLQPNDFPLTEGNQVVTDKGFFIVPEGKTAISTDIPGVSENWIIVGVDTKDVDLVLSYFLEKSNTPTDTVTIFAQGGFNQNGVVYPLAGYNFLYEYDATAVYEAELTFLTRKPDDGMPTLYGKKQDGTFETIYDIANTQLTDKIVPINGDYIFLYANFQNSGTQKIIFRKRTEVIDLKKYGDSHWGGGGGISAAGTFILAENEGVSSNKSPAQNTDILMNLFEDTKFSGLPIYLPIGNIRVNNLTSFSRLNLKGATWGGQNGFGTRLIGSASGPMLAIEGVSTTSDIQDGTISNISFDGNGIASKCVVTGELVAYNDFHKVLFKGATDVGLETLGSLIYSLDKCRFLQMPNGLRTNKSNGIQSNLIKLTFTQFLLVSNLGCDLNGGAQVVFDTCDWENCGTFGNLNTGCVKINDFSPLNEGVDVTFKSCWSEYARGGFWLDISNSKGVTTVRDTMFWKLTGDAPVGIKNNGSKLLIDGSSKINDFATNILTTNNGETRIGGFANVGTTIQNTGGVKKVQQWI